MAQWNPNDFTWDRHRLVGRPVRQDGEGSAPSGCVTGRYSSCGTDSPDDLADSDPVVRDEDNQCMVKDCTADLSQLKAYFRRFRICERHLRALSLCIGGKPSRFCQQCGRFHGLDDFDGDKRSCRRALRARYYKRRNLPVPEQEPESIVPVPAQPPREAGGIKTVRKRGRPRAPVLDVWEPSKGQQALEHHHQHHGDMAAAGHRMSSPEVSGHEHHDAMHMLQDCKDAVFAGMGGAAGGYGSLLSLPDAASAAAVHLPHALVPFGSVMERAMPLQCQQDAAAAAASAGRMRAPGSPMSGSQGWASHTHSQQRDTTVPSLGAMPNTSTDRRGTPSSSEDLHPADMDLDMADRQHSQASRRQRRALEDTRATNSVQQQAVASAVTAGAGAPYKGVMHPQLWARDQKVPAGVAEKPARHQEGDHAGLLLDLDAMQLDCNAPAMQQQQHAAALPATGSSPWSAATVQEQQQQKAAVSSPDVCGLGPRALDRLDRELREIAAEALVPDQDFMLLRGGGGDAHTTLGGLPDMELLKLQQMQQLRQHYAPQQMALQSSVRVGGGAGGGRQMGFRGLMDAPCGALGGDMLDAELQGVMHLLSASADAESLSVPLHLNTGRGSSGTGGIGAASASGAASFSRLLMGMHMGASASPPPQAQELAALNALMNHGNLPSALQLPGASSSQQAGMVGGGGGLRPQPQTGAAQTQLNYSSGRLLGMSPPTHDAVMDAVWGPGDGGPDLNGNGAGRPSGGAAMGMGRAPLGPMDAARALAAGGCSQAVYSGSPALERVSLKIHNKRPDELPAFMGTRVQEWLNLASGELVQGFVRPGCTHLILDVYARTGSRRRLTSNLGLGLGVGARGYNAAEVLLSAAWLLGEVDAGACNLQLQMGNSVAMMHNGKPRILDLSPEGQQEPQGRGSVPRHRPIPAGMVVPQLDEIAPLAVVKGQPFTLEAFGQHLRKPSVQLHARFQGGHLELLPELDCKSDDDTMDEEMVEAEAAAGGAGAASAAAAAGAPATAPVPGSRPPRLRGSGSAAQDAAAAAVLDFGDDDDSEGDVEMVDGDLVTLFAEPAAACGLVMVEAELKGGPHPADGSAAAAGGSGSRPSRTGPRGCLSKWRPLVVVPDEEVAGEINQLQALQDEPWLEALLVDLGLVLEAAGSCGHWAVTHGVGWPNAPADLAAMQAAESALHMTCASMESNGTWGSNSTTAMPMTSTTSGYGPAVVSAAPPAAAQTADGVTNAANGANANAGGASLQRAGSQASMVARSAAQPSIQEESAPLHPELANMQCAPGSIVDGAAMPYSVPASMEANMVNVRTLGLFAMRYNSAPGAERLLHQRQAERMLSSLGGPLSPTGSGSAPGSGPTGAPGAAPSAVAAGSAAVAVAAAAAVVGGATAVQPPRSKPESEASSGVNRDTGRVLQELAEAFGHSATDAFGAQHAAAMAATQPWANLELESKARQLLVFFLDRGMRHSARLMLWLLVRPAHFMQGGTRCLPVPRTLGILALEVKQADGLTLLHHAVRSGSEETVEMLLSFSQRVGLPLDPAEKGPAGISPLQLALAVPNGLAIKAALVGYAARLWLAAAARANSTLEHCVAMYSSAGCLVPPPLDRIVSPFLRLPVSAALSPVPQGGSSGSGSRTLSAQAPKAMSSSAGPTAEPPADRGYPTASPNEMLLIEGEPKNGQGRPHDPAIASRQQQQQAPATGMLLGACLQVVAVPAGCLQELAGVEGGQGGGDGDGCRPAVVYRQQPTAGNALPAAGGTVDCMEVVEEEEEYCDLPSDSDEDFMEAADDSCEAPQSTSPAATADTVAAAVSTEGACAAPIPNPGTQPKASGGSVPGGGASLVAGALGFFKSLVNGR